MVDSARRIAVLGSNSFAGMCICSQALNAGWTVLGVSRSEFPDVVFLPENWSALAAKFSFLRADLNQDFEALSDALKQFSPSIVVDLMGQGMVAESWAAPHQWYQTNLVAKSRLHEMLRKLSSLDRYIRISTPEVYGSSEACISETATYNPSTPYAVSHAAVDMSLVTLHKNYNFPMVIGRFANFYGAGQQLFRIVPRAMLSSRLGLRFPLHGGGSSIRAFIHGDDVASAVFAMIESGRTGETYHFSPDHFVSIRELVEMIAKNTGKVLEDLCVVSEERAGKDFAYLMDASKASRELGWKPQVSLEDGVARTLAWIDAHLDRLAALPHQYIHKP
jgi:dTDP-glucose 4,6-dehydratase